MKPLENRRKDIEDRKRRAALARRRAAERQHPSSRGDRDPAPVIPVRSEGDDGNKAS